MDVGTVMSAVQTLFAALEYCQLKGGIRSIASYKSQTDELRGTVTKIKAVLRDAEVKQELSEQEKIYIEQLKDAVYEADDLFDEFVTLAEQNKLNKCLMDRLFSFFSEFGVAFNMARGVKKIRKRLDAIADDLKFSFNIDPKPTRFRRPETCSYVYEARIIGRELDLEKIVGMLLDSNIQQNLSFLSIVGIGGLGKTALAQLVFNDARVTASFPLKLWTCISDEESLVVEEALSRILASATGQKNCGGFTMECLQNELRGRLEGKKFLLILDDVWTENRDLWLTFTDFLMGGLRGSWILVTTRSQETARIVGDGLIHELQGLSKENSWRLFSRAAFGPQHKNLPEDLIKIGQEIVEICADVPLAIKVVGSLLYGQDVQQWHSVKELGLSNMKGNKDGIMSVLKLSYYQLESPLKSCFGYCAAFPKDYVIHKKMLTRLWIAQGYIIPSDDHQSMEDIAKEYFSILLRRCFFQDVSKDDNGDIESCKIHDLMHDVAQQVTGKEICTLNTVIGDVDKNVRHIYFAGRQLTEHSFTKTNIRSFLRHYYCKLDSFPLDAILANWKYLRALDLSGLNITRMPDSISEMLHLRYLDLSHNPLEVLPRSFAKLYNLQTLNFIFCSSLKELPKDMSKLVKLRVLDIFGCNNLSYMPRGMCKLTCLHTLHMFVLGEKIQNGEKWFDGIEDLKSLSNLKGNLQINIPYLPGIPVEGTNDILGNVNDVGSKDGCLLNKKHLHQVRLQFGFKEGIGREEYDEAVTELMQPHFNLKRLELWHYRGARMPGWARDDNLATFLPNLVHIWVSSCPKLQYLGCLGNLRHLKILGVFKILNLEYIIEKSKTAAGSNNTTTASDVCAFSLFPSLEYLRLHNLPKLKGLVKDNDELHSHNNSNSTMTPLCLLQLKELRISDCPEMTDTLVCPILQESLSLSNGQIIMKRLMNKELTEETSANVIPKLGRVDINYVAWLYLQPLEAFQCLATLCIEYNYMVENLGEFGEMLRSCSSSLRSLDLFECPLLRSVNGGLEHLTALEKLSISHCPMLRLAEAEVIVDMPWQSLYPSLNSLILNNLPQMVYLPSWIQFLTGLQSLEISYCKGIETIPSWMPKLTSLDKLYLIGCATRLKERCQDSSGEDWHLIQHIPFVCFN